MICATLFEEDVFVAKVFSLVFLCCFCPVSSLCLGLGIGLSIGLGLGLHWQSKLVEVFPCPVLCVAWTCFLFIRPLSLSSLVLSSGLSFCLNHFLCQDLALNPVLLLTLL